MKRLVRPWSGREIGEGIPYGPAACLLSESSKELPRGIEHAELMTGAFRGETRKLLLHPYPKRGHALNPPREDFPIRPPLNREPTTPEEVFASDTLRRMNEVLARIQELEDALDDPVNLWPRLRHAWKDAEDEADPRMAEIVKQAREIGQVLKELEHRIRRVLRRTRELTPLDRVQEMDRASMLWLSKQPGRTIAERAGPAQRILSTVRYENFDTLENRVFHAYVRLAGLVAREWQREHRRAQGSDRFRIVDGFRLRCRMIARDLDELGVGIAEPGITPNYVLMQDKSYREMRLAWERLLRRERILDDLWAWQAQTWTDFAVLSIVLAIDELEEARLIAQSPIVWRQEAVTGRWFDQDRPLAVFWLEKTGRIVEVQSRPEQPGSLLTLARAHVSLRVTDPTRIDLPRRVAVWTPHAMERIDMQDAADGAALTLAEIAQIASNEVMRDGLILAPAQEEPDRATASRGRARVDAIALDASGPSLAKGMEALRDFIRRDIWR
ncbi:hypothetical protein [Fuscovulum ytuae]|uniref:DUF2357 domain-containing protein n=1 Tax=Fuscovulum ytuae TaxID=3042299 RepID=A0ABY8Q6R9_9RHOB|nr:hypothetical protein [Fuscovulum sp. YMD61]WGV16015.1 hypothetical protein QF092_17450 [Fuscovulum sp. YMD61]